jgi:hypothetical protein
VATIEEISAEGSPAFVKQIRAMQDDQLLAQQFVQQGAVHALSTLLKIGCTESNVAQMLASLRQNATLIREETKRRGKPNLFTLDQTGFQ